MDREFAALMGAPSSIRDEDITVKLPSKVDGSLDALNMSIHVRLSRLMARILTSKLPNRILCDPIAANSILPAVYGVGKEFDGSLVPNTRSILRDLARLSRDLTGLLDTHFQGSVSRASRMALRLILSYHHVSKAYSQTAKCSLLTSTVRGPHNPTFGHVCSPYSHRTLRHEPVSDGLVNAPCCVSFAVMRRFCTDCPSDASSVGR